jgi:5'-nucleotidase
MEVDPSIPQSEKMSIMQTWWSKSLQLIAEANFNRKNWPEIVKSSSPETLLRDGAVDLLNTANEHGIPTLILSAGLGDVLVEILEQNQLKLSDNLHVISNFLEFDELGNPKRYQGKIIHGLNKNEQVIKETKYYQRVKQRPNVLLLGDSIGDLGMQTGLDPELVLTIGLLNTRIDEWVDEYSKLFDVVLLGDSPLDFVNGLLKDIIDSHRTPTAECVPLK